MLGTQGCLQPFQQLELGLCAHTFQCPLSHGCLLQCPPAPHVLLPIPSTAQWGHFHFMGEICKLCCWTHAQGLCRGTPPPHTHTPHVPAARMGEWRPRERDWSTCGHPKFGSEEHLAPWGWGGLGPQCRVRCFHPVPFPTPALGIPFAPRARPGVLGPRESPSPPPTPPLTERRRRHSAGQQRSGAGARETLMRSSSSGSTARGGGVPREVGWGWGGSPLRCSGLRPLRPSGPLPSLPYTLQQQLIAERLLRQSLLPGHLEKLAQKMEGEVERVGFPFSSLPCLQRTRGSGGVRAGRCPPRSAQSVGGARGGRLPAGLQRGAALRRQEEQHEDGGSRNHPEPHRCRSGSGIGDRIPVKEVPAAPKPPASPPTLRSGGTRRDELRGGTPRPQE